ncbi:hypothetical protein F4774DRAFT_186867 [Daldinia eschscholtzii]|nr:hypothetical protein F4774DRAFT_186867 [Daldinia eschscholtzii]
MLFIYLLLILAPFIYASPTATSSQLLHASDFTAHEEISGSQDGHINATVERRQMSEGSSCEGSEGQWNCLTNQWQRCASGQWSAVVDCAAGTMCTPSGLTDDFSVQFANGAAGPSTSGSKGRFEIGTMHWVYIPLLGSISVFHTWLSS